MKRLIVILFALLLTFGAATTAPAASRDSKSKSKVEKFVQGLARDYSSHVEYSYISMNMLKSLFSLMLDEDNLDKDDKEMAKALKRSEADSLLSMRKRFFVSIVSIFWKITANIPD